LIGPWRFTTPALLTYAVLAYVAASLASGDEPTSTKQDSSSTLHWRNPNSGPYDRSESYRFEDEDAGESEEELPLPSVNYPPTIDIDTPTSNGSLPRNYGNGYAPADSPGRYPLRSSLPPDAIPPGTVPPGQSSALGSTFSPSTWLPRPDYGLGIEGGEGDEAFSFPSDEIEPGYSTYMADTVPPIWPDFEEPTLPYFQEWENSIPPSMPNLTTSRPGVFQRLHVSGTWADRSSGDTGLGFADFNTYATVRLPFLWQFPLYVSAGYDERFLNGPSKPILPSRVYDAYTDFSWNPRLTDRSKMITSLSVGAYSDFEGSYGHITRLTGKWAGTYELVRGRITIVKGMLWLDRQDIKELLMGGVIWTPNDWSRYELIFPNPRIYYRVAQTNLSEDWIYAGSDLYAGNTWTLHSSGHNSDKLTLREFRAMVGWEHRLHRGVGTFAEAGTLFERRVLFRNNPSDDTHTGSTVYLRFGVNL
jgi:hypothetical protein